MYLLLLLCIFIMNTIHTVAFESRVKDMSVMRLVFGGVFVCLTHSYFCATIETHEHEKVGRFPYDYIYIV
jgi:hypothetical protein